MSLLSSVEPLKCIICPFYREKNEHKCLLDINVKISNNVSSFPYNCPLLDGRVITIKVKNGHLMIWREYSENSE